MKPQSFLLSYAWFLLHSVLSFLHQPLDNQFSLPSIFEGIHFLFSMDIYRIYSNNFSQVIQEIMWVNGNKILSILTQFYIHLLLYYFHFLFFTKFDEGRFLQNANEEINQRLHSKKENFFFLHIFLFSLKILQVFLLLVLHRFVLAIHSII